MTSGAGPGASAATPQEQVSTSPAPGPQDGLGGDYWWLWTSSTAANLGDGVRRVAFPLLAVTLTRDPVLVSAVAAATTLPWLVVGPLAGLVVDRVDRVRLLWAVNAARAVVVTAVVVGLGSGHASIGLLVAAALLLGVGEALVDDAAIALVPRTAPEPLLERANARLYGAQVVTGQFVGQGITGALFAVAVVAPFAVDAAALLLATVAALALSRRSSRTVAVTTSASGGALRLACAGIAEGVRWLLGQRLVRALWVVLAALGFASGAFWGVIALYAQDVLGLGPTGFGVVLAVGSVGALVGSQVAPWVRAHLGVAGAMYSGAALVVLSMAGLALTRSGLVAAALLVANGVGVLVWNVVGVSLRQRVVADELLGRVQSAFSVASVGSATVGALAAGVVAREADLPAVFWMSAAVIAVAAAATAPTIAARRASAAS